MQRHVEKNALKRKKVSLNVNKVLMTKQRQIDTKFIRSGIGQNARVSKFFWLDIMPTIDVARFLQTKISHPHLEFWTYAKFIFLGKLFTV